MYVGRSENHRKEMAAPMSTKFCKGGGVPMVRATAQAPLLATTTRQISVWMFTYTFEIKKLTSVKEMKPFGPSLP